MPVLLGQQANGAVLPVIARGDGHVALAHALDRQGQEHSSVLFDGRNGHIHQDLELIAQTRQQLMIGFGDSFGIHSGATNLRNQLDQRNQAPVRQRPPSTMPCRLVGQYFDAVHDPARHGLPAFGTGIIVGSGFLRRQADPAVSVSVEMVLAFFRKKLDCPQKERGIPTRKGRLDAVERQVTVQHVGFPAELARGMGIGVRDQGNAVELAQSPVHGRIRGQSGFEHPDMGTQVPETFFQRIKPRVGPEHRKMRGPCMGRDKEGFRCALDHYSQ